MDDILLMDLVDVVQLLVVANYYRVHNGDYSLLLSTERGCKASHCLFQCFLTKENLSLVSSIKEYTSFNDKIYTKDKYIYNSCNIHYIPLILIKTVGII